MKGYLGIIRCSFLIGVVWRLNFLFTLVSNLAYIVILYFLWKSIFAGSQRLSGMSFNQVFTYMTVASSVFVLFKTWIEWFISREILSGAISMRLIKPLDYQGTMLAISVGQMLNSALIITVPSMVVLFAVFGASVPVGWNVAFFLLSLPLAYLISVLIDFSVGLTSFYTESLWGISTAKEIIVLVLSGGLIPLRFFPEEMQRLLMYLPFQAIYHTPVSILTDPSRSIASDVGMIGIQALWAAALLAASRLFFNRALKAVTVNGG